MISIQKQFLFIHVPKTGGNSIQNVLKDYSEDEIVISGKHQDGVERFQIRNQNYNITKHSNLSQYKAVLPKNIFSSLFKIATIRNPWDMMISYYFSPHAGRTEWQREQFLSLLERVSTLRTYIRETSLLTKVARKVGIQWLPQNGTLDCDIDFLIRFEHLDEDFKALCDQLEIPYTPLPKRNSSKRQHYSTYYDDELKDKVNEKFIEEITFGNYVFEQQR